MAFTVATCVAVFAVAIVCAYAAGVVVAAAVGEVYGVVVVVFAVVVAVHAEFASFVVPVVIAVGCPVA